MIKNLPSSAGDIGLIPGGRTKMPYSVRQLSPWATTGEATCCNKEPQHCNKDPLIHIKYIYYINIDLCVCINIYSYVYIYTYIYIYGNKDQRSPSGVFPKPF